MDADSQEGKATQWEPLIQGPERAWTLRWNAAFLQNSDLTVKELMWGARLGRSHARKVLAGETTQSVLDVLSWLSRRLNTRLAQRCPDARFAQPGITATAGTLLVAEGQACGPLGVALRDVRLRQDWPGPPLVRKPGESRHWDWAWSEPVLTNLTSPPPLRADWQRAIGKSNRALKNIWAGSGSVVFDSLARMAMACGGLVCADEPGDQPYLLEWHEVVDPAQANGPVWPLPAIIACKPRAPVTIRPFAAQEYPK